MVQFQNFTRGPIRGGALAQFRFLQSRHSALAERSSDHCISNRLAKTILLRGVVLTSLFRHISNHVHGKTVRRTYFIFKFVKENYEYFYIISSIS